MYKIILALAITIIVTACNNDSKTETPKTDTAKTDTATTPPVDHTDVKTVPPANDTVSDPKPGSDRDEHGCIGSAGYTWSVVKNDCIRIFEEGIKMGAKDPSLDKTLAAFAVFSNDRVRAEIFLPTQKKSVIIRQSGTGEPVKWVSGPLTLSLSGAVYSLHDDGKLLYQGTAAK